MIKIIIWGSNSFSEYLANLVEKTGVIQVEAFVEESVSTTKFAGKPLYEAADFAKQDALRDLPIILGSPRTFGKKDMFSRRRAEIGFESIRQFKLMLQRILSREDIQNPLLHPAALTEILPINYQHKALTFGLQGSGNTLINNVLNDIVRENHKYFETHNLFASFIKDMCFEYTQMLHQMIIDIIHGCGGRDIHVIPWKVGTSHFNCVFNKDTHMRIFSFPTRDHIINPTCGYHQIPSVSYIKDLQTKGIQLFFILRNPLDTMLSMLNKRQAINKQTKEINWQLFYNNSCAVINKLQVWHAVAEHMYILRYEDLIENPIAKIQELMCILNIKPSRRSAQKIWNTIAFKPIENAPKGHFWDGKKDKWLQYFKAEHIASLKEMNIEDLLLKYRYEKVLNVFKTLDSTPNSSSDKKETRPFVAEKFILPDERMETFKYIKNFFGEETCEKLNDICFSCVDEQIRTRIRTVLAAPYISKIMSAGTLPQYKTVLS